MKKERRVLWYASDGLNGKMPARLLRSVDPLRGSAEPRNVRVFQVPQIGAKEERSVLKHVSDD